jgi:hypothetical protein
MDILLLVISAMAEAVEGIATQLSDLNLDIVVLWGLF